MKVERLAIPDVLLLEPDVFRDERGFFVESFNRLAFSAATGLDPDFVQDNHSGSSQGVLHGLHYQLRRTQGKLVRVIRGRVFDVAVDLRKNSPTFGRSVSCELSEENRRQLWVPPGFAHGYLVLSKNAEILYKVTDYYAPEFERCILWSDVTLDIRWPLTPPGMAVPRLSAKDQAGKPFLLLMAEESVD